MDPAKVIGFKNGIYLICPEGDRFIPFESKLSKQYHPTQTFDINFINFDSCLWSTLKKSPTMSFLKKQNYTETEYLWALSMYGKSLRNND